ncbi:WD40 repeat domain-containing protein [Phototrophicus methaneseepsis]|uniref:WD40 repeat domain-containing protein n=1 Tax=Phototrophicus methaneseepsis TaxID=2710758 RepID=A0A7S8IDZ7_9CHLR|nr:WD40 repeat domain-containing protein [Phototrophicus methaneseepsis]QPC82047.1 WD40 repeat domain-containing protein [Phototrophicus methaneseepsis]
MAKTTITHEKNLFMRPCPKQIRFSGYLRLFLFMFVVFTSTQFKVNGQTGIKIGVVADIAYSPDGSKIAIAAGSPICSDNSEHFIKIIDSESQIELQSLQGHTCPILSVAWSPDGTKLASTGQDNKILIWDIATGQSILVMTHANSFGQFSLDWSPDGTRLVSLIEGGRRVDVWDMSTEQYLSYLEGHEDSVNDIEWSPSGNQLASGSSDRTIRIWDFATRTTIMSLSEHTASVIAVGWSPDGSKIASGGADNTLRIWDASTGQPLTVFSSSTPIMALSWSNDSSRVASANGDGNIQVIHLLPEPTIDTLQTGLGPLLDVEWNPQNSDEFAYFGRDTGRDSGAQGVLFDQLSIPVANASQDQTITDTDNDGSELVSLEGSSSSDSDGTIVDYVWTEDDVEIATGVSPQVELAVGIHSIVLTVTDNDGLTDTDTVTTTVFE